MKKMSFGKYRPYPTVKLPHRTWPNKTLTKAPTWCSVDLRDGNQALINPMNVEEKIEMFQLLVDIGFKEIEIGFPAASITEYEFTRKLIEGNHIPDDVTIQVLCQARVELIERTIESLQGVKTAIFHLYNSTSTLQRNIVFRKSKEEIIDLICVATEKLKSSLPQIPDTEIIFQYSPESFTNTELDYAVQICSEVVKIWNPQINEKVILNLPATVEVSTPNIYADQIEWFLNTISQRENIILSVHPHNDRGTAVAAAELALMAGAERVEGTLFGNGERTGNVDIVNLSLNLFSQGVDPQLNFTDINAVANIVCKCNKLPIHERHPYVGELVYTAFSGSHQDAIRKGIQAFKNDPHQLWQVPYLPIDPYDLGRKYEPIRINSQSGKGGVTYILESKYNLQISRQMQIEFGRIIQEISETTGKEVKPQAIYSIFIQTYCKEQPLQLGSFHLVHDSDGDKVKVEFILKTNERNISCSGAGNGPIDAFINELKKVFNIKFRTTDFREHTLGEGSAAEAISYYQITNEENKIFNGVGIHSNTIKSSFLAILSAINSMFINKNIDISSSST